MTGQINGQTTIVTKFRCKRENISLLKHTILHILHHVSQWSRQTFFTCNQSQEAQPSQRNRVTWAISFDLKFCQLHHSYTKVTLSRVQSLRPTQLSWLSCVMSDRSLWTPLLPDLTELNWLVSFTSFQHFYLSWVESWEYRYSKRPIRRNPTEENDRVVAHEPNYCRRFARRAA